MRHHLGLGKPKGVVSRDRRAVPLTQRDAILPRGGTTPFLSHKNLEPDLSRKEQPELIEAIAEDIKQGSIYQYPERGQQSLREM